MPSDQAEAEVQNQEDITMAHKLKLQISPDKIPSFWNPEKILTDALAERALFLENHPKYKKFQHEIDILMDKTGTSENRMTVLAVLLEAKLIELHKQLKHLNTMVRTAGVRIKFKACKPGTPMRLMMI